MHNKCKNGKVYLFFLLVFTSHFVLSPHEIFWFVLSKVADAFIGCSWSFTSSTSCPCFINSGDYDQAILPLMIWITKCMVRYLGTVARVFDELRQWCFYVYSNCAKWIASWTSWLWKAITKKKAWWRKMSACSYHWRSESYVSFYCSCGSYICLFIYYVNNNIPRRRRYRIKMRR